MADWEVNRYITDLKRHGRYREALDEIARLHPGPERTLQEADVRARLGQAKEAIHLLESLPHKSEYARGLLAGLYEHAGRHEEAVPLFEELAGHARLPAAVARRVVTYLLKADPERAVRLSAGWASEDAPGLEWRARVLAQVDKGAALALLQEATERYPDDDRLLRQYAELQLEGLSPEEKAEEYRTLVSVKKDSYALKERLVQEYRKSGELEKARDVLLEMLARRPDDLYLLSNLAYVRKDLGEIEPALELLEQVLSRKPGDTHAENAYFSTCSKNDLKERAGAFVAARAREHPEERRLWGVMKKFFRVKN